MHAYLPDVSTGILGEVLLSFITSQPDSGGERTSDMATLKFF